MAYTPALIIAASNLTNNLGLQPSADLTGIISTVTSSPLVSNYANLQPGTTYGNVLATRSFAVTSLALPDMIANANIVATSVTVRSDQILTSLGGGTYDVSKFASILQQASSFVTTSSAMSSALNEFKSKEFDELSLDVVDHVSAATNGLSNVFNSEEKLATVAAAIRNLGTAFDATQMNRLHKPAVLIANLQKQGLAGELTTAGTDEELIRDLTTVQGTELQRVIEQTKIQLPYVVSDLSQLLDLSKIFPAAAVAIVPDNNLAGLSNLFVNIGGRFKTMSDVANMLESIEIPLVPYLNAYTSLVPDAEYTKLSTKLGQGAGVNGTPLITDMIGTVAGVVHTTALTSLVSELTTVLTFSAAQTLNTQLSNLATLCAGGNVTLIDAGIVSLQSAATTFNSAVSSTTLLNNAVANGNSQLSDIRTQLENELSNLLLAGIDLTDATSTGVAGILGLVNSLHDYGVDSQSLNYNILFNNCLQSNAGGDAIKASLIEGRNIAQQVSNSVRVTTRV